VSKKTTAKTAAPTAAEALKRLVAGNERFVRGGSRLAGLRPATLAELAKGQKPFATILGCADSRVPPEWVFDAGLGELFVVRVAGNVLSPEVAGSLQYAGSHLRTPLFVVLGHEGCGAVSAALATKHDGVRHKSRIQILVDSIVPGLPRVGSRLSPAKQLTRAVEANVRQMVRMIAESPEGKARLAEGWMAVMGAVYEIESGRVRWLSAEGPVARPRRRTS
jgi:carbonic anhydrase